MKTILTAICLSTIILAACANSNKHIDNGAPIETQNEPSRTTEFSHIKYYFQDASVAPEYHRSYSIEINNKGEAKYICNSYEDILVNKNFKVSEGDLLDIQQAISEMKGVNSLNFKSMSGTTAEGLDIFDLEDKQIVDAYWNNTASASVLKLVKILEDITAKQVGVIGVAEYLSPLDKYILTEGAYINLSHHSDFNQLTEAMILAIQEYLANDKKNLFKQHFALSDYYAIDEVKPEHNGIIDIIIIHKEDFRLRFEQKQKGDSLNLENNPSGYTGTLFYDFDAEKITGMNGWE